MDIGLVMTPSPYGTADMAKIGRRPAPPGDFEFYLTRLRAYMDGEVVDRDGSPSRIEWLEDCEVLRVPIEVAATGPKVIDIAARHADRICFGVGADTERLEDCIDRARRTAEAAGRDPDSLRFGAFVNCVVNADRAVAREAIRGGLAGPLEEAISRFVEIRDCGIDFVRVVPGSRDMPRDVAATSIQALGKAVAAVADAA
ncbi:MAG: LLM class flavin-dependent oxidoreductase [Deltaproteobacteria bacterium]|nr:LLM class flavin-dependent oxidoreductase [Deltaproteobacteria bacterium]